MNLSLSFVINEVTLDQVEARAKNSKKFLKKIFNYFLEKEKEGYTNWQALRPGDQPPADQRVEYLERLARKQMVRTIRFLFETIKSEFPQEHQGLVAQWYLANATKRGISPLDKDFGWPRAPVQNNPTVRDLNQFFDYKNFAEEKDLMSIAPDELKSIVEKAKVTAEEQGGEANSIKRLRSRAKYTPILTTDRFNVWIPQNKEGACILGLGTKWCTASTSAANMFSSYTRNGDPLIVIQDRQSKAKYQYQASSGEFMDETNDMLTWPQQAAIMAHISEPLAQKVPSVAQNWGIITIVQKSPIIYKYQAPIPGLAPIYYDENFRKVAPDGPPKAPVG